MNSSTSRPDALEVTLALPEIVNPHFSKTRIDATLCWATIVFEVGGPFLLLAGRPGAVALIVMGTAFHVGVALAMGLTIFIFAFLATFPVVYYFAGRL